MVPRLSPGEGSRVDDDSSEAVAMPTDPLSERVDNDVRAMFDGVRQVRRGEGRVDDEGDVDAISVSGDCLEVNDL